MVKPIGNEHPLHNEYARRANRKRRENLNEVASLNGYSTWRSLENAIVAHQCIVLQGAQYVTVHNDLGSYTFVMSARDCEAFSLFCEQQGLVAHFKPVSENA